MKPTLFLVPLILMVTFPVFADENILQLNDVFVSSPLSLKNAATVMPINIIEGKQLRLKSQNSIGEMLKDELGIHNASFGSGVGQPVIRGQSGSRVRVLQNGIGSLDVSSLSPDHANSTEPLLAEKVEVIRGAATLLYGSGAIGGIVNIIDKRIPEKLSEQNFTTALEQRFKSVNDETSTVLSHDGQWKKLAWHLDGFYRQRDNVEIAGMAINSRAENASSSTEGFIANSDGKSWSSTIGASWIDDWGFIGFSANYLNNEYGIPPAGEEVRINLKQARYDMKAEIKQPFAFAKSLKLRLGVNDYQHNEIEEDGTVGTQFLNDAVEGRVELLHQPFAFIDQGVIGVQVQSKQFSALGAEAFVPPSDIQSYGVFAVENVFYNDWTYEFGLRVEHQSIDAQGFQTKSHTPISASVSALWALNESQNFGLSFGFAQRAPDVQELFSNGVHFATRSYEQGNTNLSEESAFNLELNFDADYDWAKVSLNLFHSWNLDYIHQHNNGSVFSLNNERFQVQCAANDECLAVLESRQTDARFYGFEAQIVIPAWESDFANLDVSLFSDYVRGKFDNGNDVPRQPPLRYGLQLDYSDNNQLAANLRFTRVEDQNRVGLNEATTQGYFLLSTAINYEMDLSENSTLLMFLKGNNLLNENSRNASSFLRNFAPEAGRGVELSFRIQF